MTSKRNTLWKTSWRRTGPALGTGPDPIWFFNNFGDNNGVSLFQQPAAAPTVGTSDPFWAGAILGTALPPASLGGCNVGAGGNWDLSLVGSNFTFPASIDVATSTLVGNYAEVTVPPYNSPLSGFQARAVVALITVQTVSGQVRQTLWIDGAIRAVSDVNGPYAPGPSLFSLSPQAALINSYVGGNALPTDDEVRTWFAATRQALSAQPIPGKTLDRYDAGTTPGVVPNPLVNLAGGQNAPLIQIGGGPFPTPANTLFQATFGY
jgi:hypothetical protein